MKVTKYFVYLDGYGSYDSWFDDEIDAIVYAQKNGNNDTRIDKCELDVSDDGFSYEVLSTEPVEFDHNIPNEEDTVNVPEVDDLDDFDVDFPDSDINDYNIPDDPDFDTWDEDPTPADWDDTNRFREAVEKLEENEDNVECKCCFDLFPKADCIKTDKGYLCKKCNQELHSHQGTNLDLIDADPFDLNYDDPRLPEENEPEEIKSEPFDAIENRKHEEGIKEDLKLMIDLGDYEPWSNAIETYELIKDANKLDDLEAYLEDCFPDGLTVTQLNDILRFDGDQVLADLGITEEEAEDEDEVDECLKEDTNESLTGTQYIELANNLSKLYQEKSGIWQKAMAKLIYKYGYDNCITAIIKSGAIKDEDLISELRKAVSELAEDIRDGVFGNLKEDINESVPNDSYTKHKENVKPEKKEHSKEEEKPLKEDINEKPFYLQQGEDGEPEYLGFAKSQDDMLDKMVKNHSSDFIYENTYIDELDKDTYEYMKKDGDLSEDEIKELDDYFGLAENLDEHINDRPADIESDQEYQGADNAVVDCKKYTLVAHSEDEKPVDCKLEKPALEEPLAGEKVDAKLYEAKRPTKRLFVIEPGYQYKDENGSVYTLYGDDCEEDSTGITYEWDFLDNNFPDEDIIIFLDESLQEAKKDEEELPVDPEAVKLEVHTMLNDLVADEIEAINGYEEAKKEIIDTPIAHKDNILDTLDHVEDEEKEHVDELISATTEIPFDKEETPAPAVEEPVVEEEPLNQDFSEVEEALNETATDVKVGDSILIVSMDGEPDYCGRKGKVEYIDDDGQLHGTWGGCAVIPGVDKFDILTNECLKEETIYGLYINKEEKPAEVGSHAEMAAKKKQLEGTSPDNKYIVKKIGNTSWESLKEELFTPEEQEEYNCDEDGESLDGYDTYHHCGWCEEVFPETEMRHEVDFGWICSRCEDELKSHGGPLTFIENESLDKDTENKE